MEGGNNVDEALGLALVDRAANLAHNRCRRVLGKMAGVRKSNGPSASTVLAIPHLTL
jgi:hypothetical protein